MTVAIPSAIYIALPAAGGTAWRRSFAVKVMMPKPRNAKKVSATLEMMSSNDGYPDGASSDRWMLAIVTTAKKVRMPTTTHDDHGLRVRDELGPGDVHPGHDDDDERREHLGPDRVLPPVNMALA